MWQLKREMIDVAYCISFLQPAWQRRVDLRAAPPRRQAEAGLRGRPLGARRLRHPLPPRHLLPLHTAHMERRECRIYWIEIEIMELSLLTHVLSGPIGCAWAGHFAWQKWGRNFKQGEKFLHHAVLGLKERLVIAKINRQIFMD